MSLLPPVFALLTADALVTSVVGTRIYRHGSAPQDVIAPYVTWFLVTGNPENLLDGIPLVDQIEVQIDCWSVNTGSGSRGIEQLAELVRNALEPDVHMTAVVADERDAETQRYRIGMQFTFWHERSEVSS